MPSVVSNLPEFESPPVVEVALSVQFEPIAGLRTAHIGRLYERFRERGFTRVEEHPPLPPAFERFGPQAPLPAGVRIELVEAPPLLRHWFVRESDTELVQIQQDRLAHNWRQAGTGQPYPRFEPLRDALLSDLDLLERYATESRLGPVVPNQCEVTYVDHVPVPGFVGSLGRPDRLLTVCRHAFNGAFLPDPEDAVVQYRFPIRTGGGEPVGRLTVRAGPGVGSAGGDPVFVLTLTARGYPPTADASGVRAFLELGREWVVRGFDALTAPGMHAVWRKVNA